MNILVVEDHGSTSFYLAQALQAEGHAVLEAFNINDAKAHWDNRETTPIHCMIVDLNMSTDGLTRSQKGESRGGLLTGWLWLRDCVLPNVPAKYRSRVIIYSAYSDDFRDVVRADQRRGIWLVPKGTFSGAGEVFKHVREISRLAE